ncbi:hypothetical protein [Nafulsella turpanensis]|uniref:hypothetical protein n=1 Tax=Nafulsella turpanensis TaxID=1265690 RepID=UPI0003478824|nr:hypothetical protein [Nafulsella turpanensis]
MKQKAVQYSCAAFFYSLPVALGKVNSCSATLVGVIQDLHHCIWYRFIELSSL